jgi:hypothetical protein
MQYWATLKQGDTNTRLRRETAREIAAPAWFRNFTRIPLHTSHFDAESIGSHCTVIIAMFA